jgi:hypothetical protein
VAEPEEPPVGAGLVKLAVVGTGAIAATSVAAAAVPDAFGFAHAVLSCVLFGIGTGGMLWAYGLGVSRSRTDDVSIPGLFFLSGDAAPAEVRKRFHLALAVETVVVVAAAAVRPFTVVAFGVLAPMFALGLMGVWGGRHAAFPPRPAKKAA